MRRVSEQVFTLFLIAMMLLVGAGVRADSAGVSENYRVLEWPDLVPRGWEPPMVAPAHDEIEARGVDPASVIEALDNTLVALPGYMVPVVFEGRQVTEFLLLPMLPHHTKQHAHLEPNQRVYIRLIEPTAVEKPLQPIWVVGTLTLNAVFTDSGMAAYSIVDALSTPYEY